VNGLPDGAFWRFSVDFYARPGVAEACLALQERSGADVNLVLLALWLGLQGHRLGAGPGRRLARLARDWQDPVIAPLRAVRRHLKRRADLPWPEPVAAWRAELAGIELGLEQVEQLLLEAAVGTVSPAPADAAAMRANLTALELDRLLDAPELETLLRTAAAAGLAGT
jgi:uncharacterized protein (TIGR02444 family)